MSELNIRKATINDASKLEECMHLAYSKYIERLNGKNIPPFNVDYKDEILNYPVFVIEKDQNILGGLILFFDKNYASIANISVNPNYQGMGLGKILMSFAQKEALSRGYKELNLATHVLLTENVSFYEKLGFIQIDKDDKKVYMKKILNSNK